MNLLENIEQKKRGKKMLALIKTILILIFLFFYIVIAVGVGVKLGLKSLLDDFFIIKKEGEGEKNADKKN